MQNRLWFRINHAIDIDMNTKWARFRTTAAHPHLILDFKWNDRILCNPVYVTFNTSCITSIIWTVEPWAECCAVTAPALMAPSHTVNLCLTINWWDSWFPCIHCGFMNWTTRSWVAFNVNSWRETDEWSWLELVAQLSSAPAQFVWVFVSSLHEYAGWTV